MGKMKEKFMAQMYPEFDDSGFFEWFEDQHCSLTEEQMDELERKANLTEEVRSLNNQLPGDDDPCDVCGQHRCICAYEPACGGKELDDWSVDELNKRIDLLNNLLAKEAGYDGEEPTNDVYLAEMYADESYQEWLLQKEEEDLKHQIQNDNDLPF